jgi:hypothetical protein
MERDLILEYLMALWIRAGGELPTNEKPKG